MSELTGQLHVTNALGMRLSVDVASEDDVFTKMRSLGKSGWSPLEIPAGGFRLPLAMHDSFDWSLIGAYALTIEDEPGVMFQGQFYKRREYEQESRGKKLPAAIKYSRGSKPTDDPRIVEKGSGDINYVTLVSFRGNGKAIARFAVPSAQRQTETQRAVEQRREEPPLKGEALADAQTRGLYVGEPITEQQVHAIEALVQKYRIADIALFAVVKDCTNNRTTRFLESTESEAAKIIKRIPTLRAAKPA